MIGWLVCVIGDCTYYYSIGLLENIEKNWG